MIDDRYLQESKVTKGFLGGMTLYDNNNRDFLI